MANFFKKAAGFLGIGSSGSGGTRDAFEQFQKYVGQISPLFDVERSRLAQEGLNPYAADLGSALDPLRGAYDRLQSTIGQARGRAAAIPDLLRQSALGRTGGAQRAAVGAARTAAGGRGGLAFGGGAGALAARAAQGAASAQSAALSDALLSGEQINIQTLLQTGAQDIGAAQALGSLGAQVGVQQAGLEERRRARLDELFGLQAQGRFGLAGAALGGGLQGNVARQGRKTSLIGSLLG